MKFCTRHLPWLVLLATGIAGADPAQNNEEGYWRAKWDPIHFPPAINSATDKQCLTCHAEILERRVLDASPAGVTPNEALAWYQTLDTYKGEQDTFHRRHLVGDYANQVMDLKCNTCHQGNDPREETAMSSADGDPNLTQRKMVNPNTCLMCHGQFPYKHMALPGPWTVSRDGFGNNCLLCHAAIRTNRHQVNFLKPEAIEELGKADGDVCYGCHGGRAWYRISYPYPRHAWPGMPSDVPEWAKGRPTESQARFLTAHSSSTEQTAAQAAEQAAEQAADPTPSTEQH